MLSKLINDIEEENAEDFKVEKFWEKNSVSY